MSIADHMPKDPKWYMRMAELEGDHEIGAGSSILIEARLMAEAFCAAKLPKSVCADGCATDPNYPHDRYGTNLLTVAEAETIFRQIMGFKCAS